jgi:aspartate dehydrogenase
MQPQIGILGCGTIGSEIASAIADGTIDASLGAVYDRNPGRATDAIADFDEERPVVTESLGEVVEHADLVVECAGQAAVAGHAVDILDAGSDLLLLSAGALADAELQTALVDAADRTDATVHVPSGAIAGLDAVKAAALTGDLEDVSLTTQKNPQGLAGARYLEENDIDLTGLDEPSVVFDGPATEAARAFPSNINVAVALSLAGTGADETTVTIVADPDEENNVHRIEATGSMGRIETEVRNVPSPNNPKTSYLAAVSAIEKLRGLTATLRVGT